MSAAKLATIMSRDLSYSSDDKEAFHKEGKAVLRKVAKALNLDKGEFEVRSNKGGIAVSGEVTLHTDKLYIQVSQSPFSSSGREVFYRTCEGRKDYTGGTNQWTSSAELLNDDLLARFRAIQNR
jgi:hypothetical protein